MHNIKIVPLSRKSRHAVLLPNRREALSLLAAAGAAAVAFGLPSSALAVADYLRNSFAYLPEPDRTYAAQTVESLMIFLGRNPRKDVAFGKVLAADLRATLKELSAAFKKEYRIYVASHPWSTETLAKFQARRQQEFLAQLSALTKVLISSPPALTERAVDGLASQYVRGFLSTYIPAITAGTDPLPQVLDQDPYSAGDKNLFGPVLFGDSTAAYDNPTSAHYNINNLLYSTFKKRFEGDAIKISKAMANFTKQTILDRVADARLRASLTLLYGTIGQAAIDTIASGVYDKVEFGQPLHPGYGAEVVEIGGKLNIIVNTKLEYEDPRLLAPIVAHETVHQDLFVNDREEMIGDVLIELVYAQLILEDTSLPLQKTAMAQGRNTTLLALANTRDENGRLNLLRGRSANIFPGSVGQPDIPSFASFYDLTGPATPGNAMLDSMLSRITKHPVSGASFSDQTVTLINNKLHDFLTPAEWLKIALALKMIVPLTLAGVPTSVAKSNVPAPRTSAGAGMPPEASLRSGSRASRSLMFRSVGLGRAE